jgi:T5SS/PEP-CTERM-associated repeat protein/autotransporter-associated beta strand protein
MVLVSDTGSLWSNTGNLFIGNYGASNSLIISNGGQVVSSGGSIGLSTISSNNSVLVTGIGSTWNSGSVEVGGNGSLNSLMISGGGMVSDSNGYVGFYDNASNNSAVVTGEGSLWTNSGNFYVGLVGASYNSLIISNGGTVIVNGDTSAIGYNGSSNNRVIVTGVGSLWSNAGTVYVGGWLESVDLHDYSDGSGALTVANGGVLIAGSMQIAGYKTSVGVLNIGSFGGNDSAGVIDTAGIAFGLGSGTINFNQTNTFLLTNPVSGKGLISQLGSGTTILAESNSFTGSAVVNQGNLVASVRGALGGVTNITVTGGRLSLEADQSVNKDATLSLEGGTLGISANLDQKFDSWTLQNNSLLDFDGYAASLTFTSLAINGSLAIWNWNALIDSISITGAYSGDLSQITFYSDFGVTEIGTGTIVNNQLQAVPEPSTYALVSLSALLLVISVKRRAVESI